MRFVALGLYLLIACSVGSPTQIEAKATSADTTVNTKNRLTFQTTEGTWLSLDAAPDGTRLVFELLGNLYTLDVSGGMASALTTGSAFDSQPSISPDSNLVAFISDRSGAENLWVMGIDGSNPRQLSYEHWGVFTSPTWRNDSKSIVVSRTIRGTRSGYELIEYDLKGNFIARHSPENNTYNVDRQISAIGAEFSPNGESLYYARRLGRHQRRAVFPVWSIHRKNLQTGSDEIFLEEQGSAFRPKSSPDGRWLAYGTRLEPPDGVTAIKLLDMKTRTSRVLVANVDHDDQESEDFNRDILPNYSFAPDSKSIYITLAGGIKRVAVPSRDVVDIPFTADVKLAIPNSDPLPLKGWQFRQRSVRMIQSPEISPDGLKIAFSALNSLYVADLSSGLVEKLDTPPNSFHPTWSPDGLQLAYVTWSPLSGGAIWIQNLDRSELWRKQVTEKPAFFSDMRWISATELVGLCAPLDRRSNTEKSGAPIKDLAVFSLQVDTGKIREIAKAPDQARFYVSQLSEPMLLSDKSTLYFHTSQGVQMLDSDGVFSAPAVQIVNPTDFGFVNRPRPVNDIQISPNGDFYLAKVQNQLFLIPSALADISDPINVLSPKARQLSRYGVDYFGWSKNGNKLFWSLGASISVLDVKNFERADLPSSQDIHSHVKQVMLNIPYPKREGNTKKLLLKGATIVPMTGSGPIIGHSILINGNRIAEIIPDDELLINPDIEVLDVSGKYILPGFMDIHAHFSVIGRGGVLDDVVAPFLANLAYGVTTIRDPQSFTNDMFAYQDLADSGKILAPRLFTTGPAIQSDNDFESPEKIRDLLIGYRDFYKTNTVKYYLAGNRQQQQWFISEANRLGLRVTVEGARNFKWDLTKVLDGFDGLEHTIPNAPLYQDVLTLLAFSGVVYTPVLAMSPTSHQALYNLERDFRRHPTPSKLARFVPPKIIGFIRGQPDSQREAIYYSQQASAAKQIMDNNGKVGVGAHALRNLQGLRYFWELKTLAADGKGLTTYQVLKAATITGAEALGLEDELGTLESGKLADLIVLTRNPLEDVSNIDSVVYTMVDGVLLESETLKTIWPYEADAPRLWWH